MMGELMSKEVLYDPLKELAEKVRFIYPIRHIFVFLWYQH
jgi:hypothetical protein